MLCRYGIRLRCHSYIVIAVALSKLHSILQAGVALDTVEQFVEEESLDPLFSEM